MTPQEQLADAVKVAPPLTVTGMTVMGYPMSDWVFALTAIYTALQIVAILCRWIMARRITPTTCVKDCSNRIRS